MKFNSLSVKNLKNKDVYSFQAIVAQYLNFQPTPLFQSNLEWNTILGNYGFRALHRGPTMVIRQQWGLK